MPVCLELPWQLLLLQGVVATMLEANPNLTPDDVKDILMGTAEDRGLDPNTQGSGYIDSEKAILKAMDMAEEKA